MTEAETVKEGDTGRTALSRQRICFNCNTLYRIGQCLERGDGDIRLVMELRQDIVTNVLARI